MAFNFVKTDNKSLKDYRAVALSDQMDRVDDLSKSLKGARVIHVNSTAIGGGVAEILQSLVPLMNDAGTKSDWMVVEGAPEFFDVTKRLHNLLQGAEGTLSREEYDRYYDHNAKVAKEIADAGVSPDVWILHDPQTLPLASLLPAGSEIIWVCHIDTTVPNQQVIDQLRPLMREAKQLVFSLPQYVVPGLEDKRVHIIPPAIDPLITKNVEATAEGIRAAFIRMGLDPDRPIMSQVSRFDLWKDPWGVIDAYRTVKKEMPAVQLAMLGVIEAKDDPEAFDVLENIHDYAAGDPDIHLYSDPALVGQLEVGAIQTGADVVIQKSIREGFGLTVTESMWKGRPVIGGNVGGIRIQIEDGANGYLVDSSEACAQRMFDMLNNPERTREMGVAARQSVRENFLTPRLMGDYLSAIQEAVGGKVPAGTGDAAAFQPAMTPDFVPGDD